MVKRILHALVLCSLVAAVGCSDDKPKPEKPKNEEDQSDPIVHQKPLDFKVTDTYGKPVAQAQVLIGTAQDRPFKNNVVVTDQQGRFTPPTQWTSALPLTISAQGFVRTTYMAQSPSARTYMVRSKAPAVKPELNGTTTGFGELKKDGFVDVGVVIPALTRTDLANFQVSTLLSPELDTINLPLGQKAQVPSNVTLPDQKENVSIVSVRLNKPLYRMFFDRKSNFRMVSAHVKFPLKKVMDESQGGNLGAGIVNHFTFLEAGITDTVITGDKQTLDLPVNSQAFKAGIPIAAPALPQTQSMLAVALVKDSEYLYPTDIKNLKHKETRTLSFPQTADGFVLGVLRNDTNETQGAAIEGMSISLNPALQTASFEFIAIPQQPKFSKDVITLSPPAPVNRLQSTATLATLSDVEVKALGQQSYEIKHPQWDVYVSNWTSEIQLPILPALRGSRKQRWEASFLAQPQSTTVEPLGPGVLKSVTHLTRSAVDL